MINGDAFSASSAFVVSQEFYISFPTLNYDTGELQQFVRIQLMALRVFFFNQGPSLLFRTHRASHDHHGALLAANEAAFPTPTKQDASYLRLFRLR